MLCVIGGQMVWTLVYSEAPPASYLWKKIEWMIYEDFSILESCCWPFLLAGLARNEPSVINTDNYPLQ